MMKYKWIIFVLSASQVISSENALAATPVQDVSSITTAVDPGLIQKRLSNFPPTRMQSNAPIKAPSEEQNKPQTAAEKIHFKLTSVTIKGNTVFSDQELQAIFKPSLNKVISVADLQNLVNQITVKYRSAGYILSRAFLPAQVIKDGRVQVQVVEGYIDRVDIKGNPGWVERVLNTYGKNIIDSRPLQVKVLERSVLLMNDLPGVSTKAVINPSPTVPAAADLTLVTDQQRVSGYVSYDNYGTRYLGPQEVGAGITLNSATFPGSSDSLHYMTVPRSSELEFIELIHTQPVGENGGKFTLGGNYTNTEPQFVLAPFDIVGRSQVIYADYSYPWIRSRDENFIVHATANYNNVSSTILGGPFYNDLIRSLIFGGDFNAIDRWRGINDAKVDFEKGFDILGAKQHLLQSRPEGVPDFFKTTVNLSRLQLLPWNLSLLAAMQGQYAFEPLLATEQYAFGGPTYGRGYDPSEIVGDDGLAGKLELRKDVIYEKPWLNAVQYYIFYDAGIVWNRDGVDLLPKQSATSIGAGMRITIVKNLTANVFYAKPLTHSINTQVLMGKDPLVPRIFFQLVASY